MTRSRKVLIGGLTLAALAAGVVAASAHRHGDWGGRMGGGHGMKGHGGMMGAVCGGKAAEMADHMLVDLEYKVKPTDAQRAAFDELKSAARTAAAKAQAGCPAKPATTADGAKPPRKSPTERLAMMEAGLAAQLDAVRTVRPAADKFYATLSDEQKAQMTGGERGEGGDWGRDKGHDRGEGGTGGGRGEGRGHRGDRGGERGGDRNRGGEPPAVAPEGEKR